MLGSGDPPPVVVTNPGGGSPFLLIGDHAGRIVPRALGDLGLAPATMDLHIAWDIGSAGLGGRLSAALDATFIEQTYSRLVIDCNRKPGAPGLIPAISDGVVVPGNSDLTEAQIEARMDAIWRPYHAAVSAALDARQAEGRPTLLVSLHSFTPVMGGFARPWRMGVLHRGDSPLSERMLALLRRDLGAAAGDNQPYRLDETDNTIPRHVDPRGLDYLELEVRQDLLSDAAGQDAVATRVAGWLGEALNGG